MSDPETPLPTTEPAIAGTRTRSRFAIRNQLLATIARSESDFVGEIMELPVIGKPHEHGMTYEKIVEKLVAYVIREYKRGRDLELLIKTGVDDFSKASGLEEPDITDEDAESRAKLSKYSTMLDMYLQREDAYNENKAKLFAVIYGQCTPKMVAGLKSQDGFKEKETKKDVVWLMQAVNKL